MNEYLNGFERKDSDKVFNCGCQEWRLTDQDFTNVEIEDGDFLVHKCEKITIHQKKGKLARVFKRAIK
jgi:hypothetical protein